MEHNSVVSGYPKSTGIPWVDVLSTGLSGFGASHDIYIYIAEFELGRVTRTIGLNLTQNYIDVIKQNPDQIKITKKKKVVPKPTQTSGWA